MTQTDYIVSSPQNQFFVRKHSKHLHETQDMLGKGDSKINSYMRSAHRADFNAACDCVTNDICTAVFVRSEKTHNNVYIPQGRASYTFVKFNDVLKKSRKPQLWTVINKTYLLARKFTRKLPVHVTFLSSEPRCFAVARKLQHRLTLYDIKTQKVPRGVSSGFCVRFCTLVAQN